jgi:Raf kinase inhibitor-like YbhB/YbcL family protein
VVEWTLFGGGHTWPGAPAAPELADVTTQEFDAAAEICRFAQPVLGPTDARRLLTRRRLMAVLGKLLKNRRAGHEGLAWNSPNLAGEDKLALSSPDFEHEGTIPTVHAGKRVGGKDMSPALTWSAVPEGAAQLLLVVEDPDAPTPAPFVHCVALVDPSVTALAQGALDATNPADGVNALRSGMGRGYRGPGPIKGHGPHRYVFQLFALATPVTAGSSGAALDSVKPRDVLAAAGQVLAGSDLLHRDVGMVEGRRISEYVIGITG